MSVVAQNKINQDKINRYYITIIPREVREKLLKLGKERCRLNSVYTKKTSDDHNN